VADRLGTYMSFVSKVESGTIAAGFPSSGFDAKASTCQSLNFIWLASETAMRR